MKAEYLAEEIRDGIEKLKERIDIPPTEDHDDLLGYMDALIADGNTLMKMLEPRK